MSSVSIKPKPEDVTNKPKVTVATVKPNIHRIKPDQENDEQHTPDDAVVKNRRLSPAMLKRSLTKVKEIDSEDDHLDASDADEDDPKKEKVASKKKDPDEEKSRKSKVKSKKTEDSDEEESKGSKVQSKKTEDTDGDIVPYEAHGEMLYRGKKKTSPPASVSAPQSEDHHSHQHRRGGWAIRKDDEFFHFIVACFAFGAVLICEHSYGDWTVSAGIGLLVFASLETIGIYFGFVTRIRAVLEGFLPLFQRSALPGFSNKN